MIEHLTAYDQQIPGSNQPPVLSVAMLNESIICSHKERERKKNMIENKYILSFRI